MTGFALVTAVEAGNPLISRAFEDVAKLLRLSLESLGHRCRADGEAPEPQDRIILLGYHLLAGPESLPGRSCIIYQLEQLAGQREDWLRLDDRKAAVLRAAGAVWDFSARNIAYLDDQGIGQVRHVPIGFHSGMQTVLAVKGADKIEEDIDVLFYGSVNARRKAVLDALARHCRVRTLYGAYGARRDALIARAKIVLNLRSFPDTSILEQPRVAFLLNNRCFVVTEDADDHPYRDAVVSVTYDRLVECCLDYLADPEGRRRMAQRGHAFLAARPMTEYLRAALDCG